MDGMGSENLLCGHWFLEENSYESLLFSAKFQALSNHNIHNPSIEAQPRMFFLIIRAGLPVTSVTVQKTFHVQYIFLAVLEGMEYELRRDDPTVGNTFQDFSTSHMTPTLTEITRP